MADSSNSLRAMASMDSHELLHTQCPNCRSGFQIVYGDETLLNYLGIRCSRFPECSTAIELDGLEPPPWLKDLPRGLESDGHGNFQPILCEEEPEPPFQVGDFVAEIKKDSQIRLSIRKVEWNFTHECWQYRASLNGQPIRRIYREAEIIRYQD